VLVALDVQGPGGQPGPVPQGQGAAQELLEVALQQLAVPAAGPQLPAVPAAAMPAFGQHLLQPPFNPALAPQPARLAMLQVSWGKIVRKV